jgi:hypothetical protein
MVTTERAHDISPTGSNRAARLRVVAAHGELVESREALRIRPLIEHPALRRAMGLDAVAESTPSTPSHCVGCRLPTRRAGSHQSAGLLRSNRSTAAPAAVTVLARPRTAAPGRRFDRRALLESAT